MAAYATPHTLVRLQLDLLEYDPDLVLVMHAVNDLTVAYDAAHVGSEVDGHYAAKYSQPGFTGE